MYKLGLCEECYLQAIITLDEHGKELLMYVAQLYQRPFHESDCPNLLALGTRGTGKSTMLRWDAITRCLMFPGFRALIIRRKMTDLRKSHLHFIGQEMKMLGGKYRETTADAIFPNGSVIQFSHCEHIGDVSDYLSSEWDYIGFDELPTFTLDMFLKISAAARSNPSKGFKALVRACGNPLGIGAAWMKAWFIDHNVDLSEYPDYCEDDFQMQFSTLDQNKFVDRVEYEKRLRNVPEHIRRAWLLGEFVIEGAYFTDFQKNKQLQGGKVVPWHCIAGLPTWQGQPLSTLEWIRVYRSVDWGYNPDPAVCHWHLVLPNGRKITFKEKTWKRTLAKDVATEIKSSSKGLHITETFCDPTMFIKTGETAYSIAEIFEQNGVPLTPAQNDRAVYGYALHEMLNTLIDDLPSWQIVTQACPELVRTLPILEMDKNDPEKIANGPDHWAVSCAYFAMGSVPTSRDPAVPSKPRWMMPKRQHVAMVG